jgi:hypothetical protein
MTEYTPLQLILAKLRDERCGGNTSELARQIGKDVTYVHRLFYPAGKPGARGIGMEIIAACNRAFKLPPGFWDGVSAFWPFSEELQQVVSRLDEPSTARLESVMRATLGLGQIATPAVDAKQAAEQGGAILSSSPTEGVDSTARVGLAAVQSAGRSKSPLLDEEDARHQREQSDERRKAGPASTRKPENSGHSG